MAKFIKGSYRRASYPLAFPIFTSSDYASNKEDAELEPEEDKLLEGYQKQLDDGEIVVIVNATDTVDAVESNQILQETPETDSHPDVESMADVLEQEKTVVPETMIRIKTSILKAKWGKRPQTSESILREFS